MIKYIALWPIFDFLIKIFHLGLFSICTHFLDPWVSMEDEYSLMPKRSSNIWKKNQDADLMRIGKRSAFNDDMVCTLICKCIHTPVKRGRGWVGEYITNTGFGLYVKQFLLSGLCPVYRLFLCQTTDSFKFNFYNKTF